MLPSLRRPPALLSLLAALLSVDLLAAQALADQPKPGDRRLLYVVAPGIRNYLEFGGAGVLVFDVANDHKFVKRIATPESMKEKPENIKGVCASAATRKLYFTTLTRLYCLDLVSEKTLWHKALPGGCDRMSITPDGKFLYVPSYEKEHWNVVDGATGAVVKTIVTKSGAHNTALSPDGKRVYLAGLRSPILTVVDTKTHEEVGKIGPFTAPIRPFTVSNRHCFVNVNGLLGIEIGDVRTGEKLYRVEVEGFKQGKIKRHGCPSHGIGLMPDGKEAWVCDAANERLHVFDVRSLPPKQLVSIKLREQPGWVSFSVDGKYAYSSTGEVIDTQTKKIVAALFDENGKEVHSEKLLEIVFRDGVPVIAGDQFGREAPPARRE